MSARTKSALVFALLSISSLASAEIDSGGDKSSGSALFNHSSRLREDQQKAEKIVAAIAAEIEPLAAAGKGEEAQTRLKTMIAKVETSGQSDSVKKMTISKLKVLGIKVASAKKTEKRDQSMAARKADEEKAAQREQTELDIKREEMAAVARREAADREERKADAERSERLAAAGENSERLEELEAKL